VTQHPSSNATLAEELNGSAAARRPGVPPV